MLCRRGWIRSSWHCFRLFVFVSETPRVLSACRPSETHVCATVVVGWFFTSMSLMEGKDTTSGVVDTLSTVRISFLQSWSCVYCILTLGPRSMRRHSCEAAACSVSPYDTPRDPLLFCKAGVCPRTDRQFRSRATPTPLRVPQRRQPRLECVAAVRASLTAPRPGALL